MKIVVFGLTISSSWGNGHATLWRGLCRALSRDGHQVTFFERDVPYYAETRDLHDVPGGELVLYSAWDEVQGRARSETRSADLALVTSYCPDGVAATDLVLDAARAVRAFYDLDTPVTLARLSRGERVDYIGSRGLGEFDLIFSYTGGGALRQLRERLGARRVVPLYGHVDPDIHRPAAANSTYASDVSYLGTYAADRQDALNALFIEAARQRPDCRFLIGGAQYPQNFPWTPNIFFVRHLPPAEHPAFFCSSRLTLNVTRSAMAEMGWCPSGRLFEATACGATIITDCWEGLDEFFEPGEELLVAASTDDVLAALALPEEERLRIAARGRERTLAEHTARHRAAELIRAVEGTRQRIASPALSMFGA